jgi:hypothetical protein
MFYTTQIQNTLNETRLLMVGIVRKILQRGEDIHAIEHKAEQLEASSTHFVIRLYPWYKRCWIRVKRCFPYWWCRRQKKITKEPPPIRLQLV